MGQRSARARFGRALILSIALSIAVVGLSSAQVTSTAAETEPASDARFVTTWAGLSATLCLYGDVDVVIDWGDGSPLQTVSGYRAFNLTDDDGNPIVPPLRHTFATTAATHQVTATGTFDRLGCFAGYEDDLPNLVSVREWGATGTTDLESAFEYTESLSEVAEPPHTVTSMVRMFHGSAFDRPIGHWNTSGVRNMNGMFAGSSFNQPLAAWDTSAVRSMDAMFQSSDFNQPINNWNTSNVTSMTQMFTGSSFNQPLGSWDTSSVTSMADMFSWSSFNQPIGEWDTSNVEQSTYWGMVSMFRYNDAFNQDLSGWCVSQITAKPTNFDAGATAWTLPRPVWGTCPGVTPPVDTTDPTGSFYWKTVNAERRVWTRGGAADNVAVTWARVSFQDIATGKWLRRDGTLGAYQAWPATLVNPGATATDWKFNAILPPGSYYMRLVLSDAAGNLNKTPRPQRRVDVP